MAKIIVHQASVEFPVYESNTSVKKDTNTQLTGGIISNYRNKRSVVKALDTISFHLSAGDRVGILGHNGAGKSTLLRLLAGIYEPVSGYVHTEGVVAPMLSLSQGIEREATGYENILIRGIFLGMSKKEIQQKQAEIAEFSELGEYLAMPVRTYSSGMLVRLAFAISCCVRPDILLLDEVFGAGDGAFRDKAQKKMYELIEQSKIIVFATHSIDLMLKFCNKVLILQLGKLMDFGDMDTVLPKHPQFCPEKFIKGKEQEIITA